MNPPAPDPVLPIEPQECEPPGFRQPAGRQLKFAVRNGLARALLPLARLLDAPGRYVTILSYHRVLPGFPAGSPRSAVVDPRQFDEQMRLLAAEGYATLSLAEFGRIVRQGTPAPLRRPVLITFDDGYADNYLLALEIAARHGATLNFFLPTGIIGQPQWPYPRSQRTPQEEWHMRRHPQLWRPLTWDEARAMRQAGAHLGCHGYLHQRLSRLGGTGLDGEIAASAAAFAEHLGERPRHFSIPWGDPDAFGEEALDRLREHGFECIYTTEPRRTRLPAAGDVFPRISVREHDDPASFARKLRGAHDLLNRLLAPLRGGL